MFKGRAHLKTSGFSGNYAHLNKNKYVDLSILSVFKATVVVGMQRGGSIAANWKPFIHKLGMGLSATAFLEIDNQNLILSPEFKDLDGTEKGVVSYWYGMAFAKLIVDAELKVPWLEHVDEKWKSGKLILSGASKERGDLAGMDRGGGWHVVEAKGRSHSCTSKLVKDAKQQASNVKMIENQIPETRSVVAVSLGKQPISIIFTDPPSNEDVEGEIWKVSREDFFEKYYRNIIEYLKSQEHERVNLGGKGIFVCARLFPREETRWGRAKIGLLQNIFLNPQTALHAVEGLPEGDSKIGSDGIVIFDTVWDSERDEIIL
ncbi:MAG: hypothetical protein DKT66_23235 [Candidatus Melainabacteria bacterium]|nr:MAG: hypothetical protein DKT66_23235 [Candidatus Melainabacteria bacterium]